MQARAPGARVSAHRCRGVQRHAPQHRCRRFKVAAIFSVGGLLRSKSRSSSAQQEANELLQLLLEGRNSSEDRVSQLVDSLSTSCLDFKEQLLGGGPWQVVYTKGSAQLWKATYNTGKLLVSRRNTASQDLEPRSRSVINAAQFAGDSLYVTASGTYTPVNTSPSMPKAIRADISSGALHLLGLRIPLPIRGSGSFEVVYLDRQLRIFRSGGAYSVQVRSDVLQRRQ